jgi:hypothetical protein
LKFTGHDWFLTVKALTAHKGLAMVFKTYAGPLQHFIGFEYYPSHPRELLQNIKARPSE